MHRAGAGARRHVPPRRVHPDEGMGADRTRAARCARDLREARRRRFRAAARLHAGGCLEGRRRQADDRRHRLPLQGVRRRVGAGEGAVHERDHDRRRGRGGRHLQERDRRHRVVSGAPADPGPRLAALRRLDRPPGADRGPAPARRPRRRHHRLRVRLDLRPFRQRGDDHRDAADADPAGGRGCGEGAAEGVQEARHRRCNSRSSARASRTRATTSS